MEDPTFCADSRAASGLAPANCTGEPKTEPQRLEKAFASPLDAQAQMSLPAKAEIALEFKFARKSGEAGPKNETWELKSDKQMQGEDENAGRTPEDREKGESKGKANSGFGKKGGFEAEKIARSTQEESVQETPTKKKIQVPGKTGEETLEKAFARRPLFAYIREKYAANFSDFERAAHECGTRARENLKIEAKSPFVFSNLMRGPETSEILKKVLFGNWKEELQKLKRARAKGRRERNRGRRSARKKNRSAGKGRVVRKREIGDVRGAMEKTDEAQRESASDFFFGKEAHGRDLFLRFEHFRTKLSGGFGNLDKKIKGAESEIFGTGIFGETKGGEANRMQNGFELRRKTSVLLGQTEPAEESSAKPILLSKSANQLERWRSPQRSSLNASLAHQEKFGEKLNALEKEWTKERETPRETRKTSGRVQKVIKKLESRRAQNRVRRRRLAQRKIPVKKKGEGRVKLPRYSEVTQHVSKLPELKWGLVDPFHEQRRLSSLTRQIRVFLLETYPPFGLLVSRVRAELPLGFLGHARCPFADLAPGA